MPYLLWLVTLPLFGAAGAYLSSRAGGNRITQFAASIFPSIALLCLLVFVGAAAIFVEKNAFVRSHPVHFALVFVPWVIFPALTLLLGAFPFLILRKPTQV